MLFFQSSEVSNVFLLVFEIMKRKAHSSITSIFMAICLSVFASKTCAFTNKDVTNDMYFIKACNLSSPISPHSMNNVLLNKNLENSQSRAFKCFLHCLLTKYGWMDEDGGFLIHDMRETLLQSDIQISTLEYILYTCTTVQSADRCHRAYYFTDCFWKKMDEEQPTADELFYSVETSK